MENLLWALLLIVLGLILMVVELVLFSGGILFVASIGCLVAGAAMTFTAGPMVGLLSLVGLMVAIYLLVTGIFQLGPRTAWGRRIFLDDEPGETLAQSPAARELEKLRGSLGRTVTRLLPAGIAEFEGKRVDVISEGLMIEEGTWVQCIDVREGRVIVRPMPGVTSGE